MFWEIIYFSGWLFLNWNKIVLSSLLRIISNTGFSSNKLNNSTFLSFALLIKIIAIIDSLINNTFSNSSLYAVVTGKGFKNLLENIFFIFSVDKFSCILFGRLPIDCNVWINDLSL